MDGEVRSPPQSEHVLAGNTKTFPRAPAWDRFSDLLVEKTDRDSVLCDGVYLGDWSTTGVQLGGGRMQLMGVTTAQVIQAPDKHRKSSY